MYNDNIANFILYDMAKSKPFHNYGVDSNIISEVVEGWNRQIYVFPKQSLIFNHRLNRKNIIRQ